MGELKDGWSDIYCSIRLYPGMRRIFYRFFYGGLGGLFLILLVHWGSTLPAVLAGLIVHLKVILYIGYT